MSFFLTSKKREAGNLLNKFLTTQEKNKRALFSIGVYLIPVLFVYLFLMVFGSLVVMETRLFFYIPLFFLIVASYKVRFNNEAKLIALCNQRNKELLQN